MIEAKTEPKQTINPSLSSAAQEPHSQLPSHADPIGQLSRGQLCSSPCLFHLILLTWSFHLMTPFSMALACVP